MKMQRLILPALALVTTMSATAAEYVADFAKPLDDGWSFVREDKTEWRLKDGNLELLAQPTNIWAQQNDGTENFLLRALPAGPSTVEVTLDFDPRKEYEQAGLMIYLDDDNYIKFDRELYDGPSCTLVLESDAKPDVVKKIPFREGPLRLRLEIADGTVKGMVKAPGDKDWTPHGETTLPGSANPLRVGLFALLGDATAPRWARFKDFAITSGAKETSPAAALDGYRFEFPVVGEMPENPKEGADGDSALVKGDPMTTDNFKAVKTFGGETGKRYQVTLRFRGVVEPMMYKDGTKDGDYFYIGGEPDNGTYNIYKIGISSPESHYFLNRQDKVGHQIFTIDYTKTIEIDGGATVTLSGDGQNGRLITNFKKLVVPDVAPAPKPFHGQFVQIDVVDVVEVK
jgi:regulation of enolase protein 1 (concanavalin A-like superfamily)